MNEQTNNVQQMEALEKIDLLSFEQSRSKMH